MNAARVRSLAGFSRARRAATSPAEALLSSRPMVVGVIVFIHFIVSLALITLVLMHSGREAGMGGMGFVPASQGGTHIVERNLTRLTIAVALVFVGTTVILFRLLQ
jgi:preprotein translocase subunit SecG